MFVMVFALVHFTVGFVAVLVVLSLIPATRYRLTGAYAGGVWALGPDAHHLLGGTLGSRINALHSSQYADLFFFHYTLDGAAYRAHNLELTVVASAVLGFTFVCYDRRFGRIDSVTRQIDTVPGDDEAQTSD